MKGKKIKPASGHIKKTGFLIIAAILVIATIYYFYSAEQAQIRGYNFGNELQAIQDDLKGEQVDFYSKVSMWKEESITNIKKNMHIGFVLLNCDLGAEEYILDELQQVPQIKNAYVTFGAYDIIAEIHAETQEEFERTVSMNIRRLSRIVSTMTLNVVSKNE